MRNFQKNTKSTLQAIKFGKLQTGFTLIELLLYMGIFALLLTVMTQIFTGILTVKAESQASSSIDQEQNYILSRLAYDIHRATQVVTPSTGTPGSTLHITGNGLDETFTIQDGVLKMTNNLTGTIDAVSGFDTTATVTFTNLSNTPASSKASIQINLILTSKTLRYGQNAEVKGFKTTVQTR